jgi:hypothetical protein
MRSSTRGPINRMLPASAAIAGDRMQGYGVIRKCLSGWKIGPLFADDAGAAERSIWRSAAGATMTAPSISMSPR